MHDLRLATQIVVARQCRATVLASPAALVAASVYY